jgi:hypothetical protein
MSLGLMQAMSFQSFVGSFLAAGEKRTYEEKESTMLPQAIKGMI